MIESLQQKKYRAQYRQFMLEGIKLLKEAVAAQYPLSQIYISRSAFVKNLLADVPVNPNNIKVIRDSEIRSMSSLKNPEGVVAIGKIPQSKFLAVDSEICPFLYLWEINDPGNLGTILRTARWFGVRHVLLSPNSADPFSPKVVRGSMGAIFYISIRQNVAPDDLFDYCIQQNIAVFCADPTGAPVLENMPKRWGLVLGNESHGLPEAVKHVAHDIIAIPKYGNGESLNVAVSAGILLYELLRQEKA
ncbi:MAG TPA: RNA methyltransferase [Candidatus Marinimicrobia bacterium]|nr:RNA methyltransferase [Candidatus Neomarinimicrobiota bacterium]